MGESLRSVLVGTSALSAALVVALFLTLARPGPSRDPALRDRVLRLFLLGIATQCLHVVEEFVTGFHTLFPLFLGLSPWTPEFFVSFNLVWIAIWVLSVAGLWHSVRAALLPTWFFAIGMAVNGVAHPALALQTGGYFPGLVTSPLVGLVGAVLWYRLLVLTRETT